MAKKKDEEDKKKKKKKSSSKKTKTKKSTKSKSSKKKSTKSSSTKKTKKKSSSKKKSVKKSRSSKPSKKSKSSKSSKKKKEEAFVITEVNEKDNVIKWKAPDYYTFEKGPLWSLAVGLIATGASMVLIYTGNYLPVIIIILAVIVSFQLAHEKPNTEEFAIDEGGVIARNEYVPYKELKSFWVTNYDGRSILYLETASIFKGPITMPLGNKNVAEVKAFLLAYLPEKFEYGEIINDKLIRIFKL